LRSTPSFFFTPFESTSSTPCLSIEFLRLWTPPLSSAFLVRERPLPTRPRFWPLFACTSTSASSLDQGPISIPARFSVPFFFFLSPTFQTAIEELPQDLSALARSTASVLQHRTGGFFPSRRLEFPPRFLVRSQTPAATAFPFPLKECKSGRADGTGGLRFLPAMRPVFKSPSLAALNPPCVFTWILPLYLGRVTLA